MSEESQSSTGGQLTSTPVRRHVQDELDARIVYITRPAKLLVAALIVVIVAIGIWSFAGTIPTNVSGDGIILRADAQVYRLQSSQAGRVADVMVAAGDAVAKDSAVVELAVNALDEELQLARDQRDELKASMSSTEQRLGAELAERQDLAGKELQALSAALDAAQSHLDGMSSDSADYHAAVSEMNGLSARIFAIQTQLFEARSEQAATLAQLRQRITAQEQRVQELERQVATVRQVTAPAAGIIGEVRTQIGQVVDNQDVLVTVISSGEGHEILAFFPIETGGRITEGMPVHISPDTVKREQYGSILGHVASISEGPVSSSRIGLLLGNVDLADMLTSEAAAYVAHIALNEDGGTPSGYAWTSGVGPPFAVTTRTPVSVNVLVREEPPIALVVPALRQVLAD